MRTIRFLAPLALSLSLALTGCSGAVEGDDLNIESGEGSLTAAEVAATKAQIRAIALPNIERLDNLPQGARSSTRSYRSSRPTSAASPRARRSSS